MNIKDVEKIKELQSKISDPEVLDMFLKGVQSTEKAAEAMRITWKSLDWNKLSPEARLELAIQEAEQAELATKEDNTSDTSDELEQVTIELEPDSELATKATKKKKVEIEVEEEPDDMMEEDMMEDDETTMKADSEYMGKVMSPMMTELKACVNDGLAGLSKELKGYFQDMLSKQKPPVKSQKELDDVATALEVSDNNTQRIAQLEDTVKQLDEFLKTTKERMELATKELNEIKGIQPPVIAEKNFLGIVPNNGRPTQSPNNIVGQGLSEAAMKQFENGPVGQINSFVERLTKG